MHPDGDAQVLGVFLYREIAGSHKHQPNQQKLSLFWPCNNPQNCQKINECQNSDQTILDNFLALQSHAKQVQFAPLHIRDVVGQQ